MRGEVDLARSGANASVWHGGSITHRFHLTPQKETTLTNRIGYPIYIDREYFVKVVPGMFRRS